jgi:hypothetical protein
MLPEALLPEPWLRGPIGPTPTLIAPVIYSFLQAREDIGQHTFGLTTEQIWAKPYGLGSAGFHVRHIGRSVDRLVTYLMAQQLSPEQMAALDSEHEAGASREELLAELSEHLDRAEAAIRTVNPASLAEPRTVGRKQLPTTVIGLLTHIAEHTQRHVGQAISAAKLIRIMSASTDR